MAVAEALHRKTEGNPLLIVEIIRFLIDLDIGDASVIGREFERQIVGDVAELADEQLLQVLGEAQRMRVIEDISEPPETRFRFVHALSVRHLLRINLRHAAQ